jgi:hypothetical protein
MTKNRPGKRRLRGYKRSPGRPYSISAAAAPTIPNPHRERETQMQLKITGGKGFHAIMSNGVTLSVQIGGGNYCDNFDEEIGATRERGFRLPPSFTAEVAIWVGNGGMLELPEGDTVAGWVSVAKVFDAIPRLAALQDPTPGDVIAALGETFFRRAA